MNAHDAKADSKSEGVPKPAPAGADPRKIAGPKMPVGDDDSQPVRITPFEPPKTPSSDDGA